MKVNSNQVYISEKAEGLNIVNETIGEFCGCNNKHIIHLFAAKYNEFN